ncbi:hypothetical protein CUJ83_11675 [Methanocella sp. CWC-04]|uniref:Uncharacterized protein n=1 Tax=Methanooceanicella nereidis TaxID=2052831 RepID=A0AAP2RF21_9EURY|nr:MTH865 family protein [Methanocella sp. CWC-04]MCD1295656.1 hypothetical protein [Methanocella sp. CWC-04]
MVEKSAMIGREPHAPAELEEIEDLKIRIVNQLRDAEVQFPIRNKDELKGIYPKGTPHTCMFKGKEISIHEFIDMLDDSDFPVKNAGDAATLLTSKCMVVK